MTKPPKLEQFERLRKIVGVTKVAEVQTKYEYFSLREGLLVKAYFICLFEVVYNTSYSFLRDLVFTSFLIFHLVCDFLFIIAI